MIGFFVFLAWVALLWWGVCLHGSIKEGDNDFIILSSIGAATTILWVVSMFCVHKSAVNKLQNDAIKDAIKVDVGHFVVEQKPPYKRKFEFKNHTKN